jgi:hypothetical protein
MPAPSPFAELIGSLTDRQMDQPQARAKRIEEAFIAHLLDNGHDVRVPVGTLVIATRARKGYHLVAVLDEDTAELVFSVKDKDGQPVQARPRTLRTGPARPPEPDNT